MNLLLYLVLSMQISVGFGDAGNSGIIEAQKPIALSPGQVKAVYRKGPYKWQVVNPPGHQILVAPLADGRTLCIVPAGVVVGTQIDLIGAGRCGEGQLPDIERLSFQVVNGPAPVPPGPGPDPDPPTPEPEIPNAEGVGRVAWDGLQALGSVQRLRHCRDMAKIWESGASRLAADSRLAVSQCVQDMLPQFRQELGQDLATWAKLQDALSSRFVELQKEGKLNESESDGWVRAFNEIAAVFRMAAK